LRADARPVHEAGGTEAQEIGAALSCGIAYLRALEETGSTIDEAGAALNFAVAAGADVLLETAKLRALRLCWARVMDASGATANAHAAHIHAFTSRRMMTRYDAWTNILRVTTAAFAAGIGGADAITTRPFTDALGLPTRFARRVARNTQNVLLEECRLGHVADPAGGAWFVEKLTRDLAEAGWRSMQSIEASGGIVAALRSGKLQAQIAEARAVRQRAVAARRESITGVTDFPLLGAPLPEFIARHGSSAKPTEGALAPIRWADPFETLRDRAEVKSPRPAAFFATLGPLAQFGPRAQFARNLLAAGGVGAIGEETEHASVDAMIDALRESGACVAVICGTDAAYAEHGENAAQRLKAGGAAWVVLAGRPGESETKLRAAGVDQFVFTGQDALAELSRLHAALGLTT
jgi:methylmalonyl-CoA mutase